MRTAAFALFAAVTLVSAPLAAEELSADAAAVKQVVIEAYIDGIHNFYEPDAIRKGFHPDFQMLALKDGKLEKVPLETWIARLGEANAKSPRPARESGMRTTRAEFPVIEVAGTAAFCRVELSREGRLLFTDFLSLYKFEDGWKIVGKSYFRHP